MPVEVLLAILCRWTAIQAILHTVSMCTDEPESLACDVARLLPAWFNPVGVHFTSRNASVSPLPRESNAK